MAQKNLFRLFETVHPIRCKILANFPLLLVSVVPCDASCISYSSKWYSSQHFLIWESKISHVCCTLLLALPHVKSFADSLQAAFSWNLQFLEVKLVNIHEFRLLILHIPSLSMVLFMWFSLGVVSWMILIHNFSAYSISCVCNGPVDLLTIGFRLNRRIHPVILNSFLYVNLLVVLVIKWLQLSSMVAMVTITFSLIFNIFTCVSFGSNNCRLCWPVFFVT